MFIFQGVWTYDKNEHKVKRSANDHLTYPHTNQHFWVNDFPGEVPLGGICDPFFWRVPLPKTNTSPRKNDGFQ